MTDREKLDTILDAYNNWLADVNEGFPYEVLTAIEQVIIQDFEERKHETSPA